MLKVICATWSELYAGLMNEWINSDFTSTSSPPHKFFNSIIFLKSSCPHSEPYLSRIQLSRQAQ